MIKKYQHHLLLHFTILIWGLTGVIGRFLNNSGLESQHIVFWRMLIGWLSLMIYILLTMKTLAVNKKVFFQLLGNGVLVALHWYFFFEAIARSNVSVALVFMSTTALFTSFVEPIITSKKFNPKELITSVLVIIGIIVIVNDLTYLNNNDYFIGVIYSLISALLAALFSVINSVLVKKCHSAIISFYELLGGFLILSVIFFFSGELTIEELSINSYQLSWLLFLGVICTSFAFLMGVYVMKFIPAYTVNLSVNLEPIYAIILALLFFRNEELMSYNFYIGAIIILGSILLNAFFKKQKKRAT